jgi:hypothetical protein
VSSEEPGHGCAEIASGEQFCGKEARDVLTDLLGGEGFGFFLGTEVTEMRMAGAARSAALAAVGKKLETRRQKVEIREERFHPAKGAGWRHRQQLKQH